jgi:hypothetical protein
MQLGYQRLLVLVGGKTSASVRPNRCQVTLADAAVPRRVVHVIPQALELRSDETEVLSHIGMFPPAGRISEVRFKFAARIALAQKRRHLARTLGPALAASADEDANRAMTCYSRPCVSSQRTPSTSPTMTRPQNMSIIPNLHAPHMPQMGCMPHQESEGRSCAHTVTAGSYHSTRSPDNRPCVSEERYAWRVGHHFDRLPNQGLRLFRRKHRRVPVHGILPYVHWRQMSRAEGEI